MKKLFFSAVAFLFSALFSISYAADPQKFLIIGAYEFPASSGLTNLDGTKDAIDNIRELTADLNSVVVRGKFCTMDFIEGTTDFLPTTVLIAGHGVTYPPIAGSTEEITDFLIPVYSYSPLYASEETYEVNDDAAISISKFKEFCPRGADLVILSCSNSNNPYVVNTLKNAGVKSLILANGEIDDVAAPMFLVEFYKNLKGGKSKQEAFKAAQNKVKNFKGEINGNQYDFSDPKYWDSFVFVNLV